MRFTLLSTLFVAYIGYASSVSAFSHGKGEGSINKAVDYLVEIDTTMYPTIDQACTFLRNTCDNYVRPIQGNNDAHSHHALDCDELNQKLPCIQTFCGARFARPNGTFNEHQTPVDYTIAAFAAKGVKGVTFNSTRCGASRPSVTKKHSKPKGHSKPKSARARQP